MTTIAHVLAAWIEHRAKLVKLDLVRESTWRNQTQIAGTLAGHLGDHALGELRKSHIELFIGERLRTCARVTVAGELAVLKQVVNWAVDENWMQEADRPRFPRFACAFTEEALPDDAAFLWVLTNSNDRHATALEFMLLTGLAPHELERLQTQDARWREDDEGEDRPYEIAIGLRDDFLVKGESRRRTVPLNRRAASLWIGCTMASHPVYRPFPRVAAMEKYAQRLRAAHPDAPAGVESITPKMMRKWFSSKVSGDVAENVLQTLLGHAPGSPITRKHYVRSQEAQRIAAVDGLAI